MKAAKSLRQPTNWQDFETLCKKLWGEIWSCPEIKKNGRSGQNQNGVDVYGIPAGETEYYGIQCKGKEEYTHRQFSEQEIIAEIQKARSFQPSLKKLYFATTAVKDARTEEFVRTMNLSNINAGIFEVHLFCWEDIVELIDENRLTHDWYADSQNFRSTQSVAVYFDGGADHLDVEPLFNEVTFSIRPPQFFEPRYFEEDDNFIIITMPDNYGQVLTNNSFFGFQLAIHNDGNRAIEKFQLIVRVTGDISKIATTNKENSHSSLASITDLTSGGAADFEVNQQELLIRITPRKEMLVGDDHYISDRIYIKPAPKIQVIELQWKLISKDFKTNGTITISSTPKFEKVNKPVRLEDMPRDNSLFVEDFLE